MKSRRVRRMRHTRGRGRAMKRGGMFSSLNPFSPSIKSHGPVVDNNYYLVDDHGHTPYGVYEYYQKNEGRYFGVALSSDIVFNRWVPRRYVNGSIANSNWAKEGDSLYIDFVKLNAIKFLSVVAFQSFNRLSKSLPAPPSKE